MEVDAEKWPMTSEFLRVHRLWHNARVAGAPTLSWAYGTIMDRNDAARVPRLVALHLERAAERAA